MEIIKTKDIKEVQKHIEKYANESHKDWLLYALEGHGIPEAEKKREFSAIIKRGKYKKEIKILYFYSLGSDFKNHCWTSFKINLNLKEKRW